MTEVHCTDNQGETHECMQFIEQIEKGSGLFYQRCVWCSRRVLRRHGEASQLQLNFDPPARPKRPRRKA